MEVDKYVKRRSILEENIQKVYYTVLGKCTTLLKKKLMKSKGWREAYIKFNALKLIKTIKSKVFKFEDQKYTPIFLHQ